MHFPNILIQFPVHALIKYLKILQIMLKIRLIYTLLLDQMDQIFSDCKVEDIFYLYLLKTDRTGSHNVVNHLAEMLIIKVVREMLMRIIKMACMSILPSS